MRYIPRLLENGLQHHLKRGKSVLLLGPRQVGKSTLVQKLSSSLTISLIQPPMRQRYERDLSLFGREVEALTRRGNVSPLVIVDEVSLRDL